MKFRDRKAPKDESPNFPFIKLRDTESAIGVFAGDPYEFYQHWEGEQVGGRSVICPGRTTCARCKEGHRATFRFRLNLIVKEGDAYVAKVFEQGAKVYDNLRDLESEYGLEKTLVKITRKGSNKNDTTYTILPVKQQLTQAQLLNVAKTPLVNLAPSQAPAEEAIEETVDDTPF